MKLVIVGDTSHTDVYVKQIRQAASKNVIFTGYVYGELLDELYSNAYAFVLPSDVEGLPIGLLEALSFGVPAITSDIEANVEIMGRDNLYGLTFEKSNVEDLASKLEMALSSSQEFLQKGESARKFVIGNFNWDKIAARTEEVYKKLLNF
jgi:glycosyltransferase involved in cell wall biosynthesis